MFTFLHTTFILQNIENNRSISTISIDPLNNSHKMYPTLLHIQLFSSLKITLVGGKKIKIRHTKSNNNFIGNNTFFLHTYYNPLCLYTQTRVKKTVAFAKSQVGKTCWADRNVRERERERESLCCCCYVATHHESTDNVVVVVQQHTHTHERITWKYHVGGGGESVQGSETL
jgi:hypothetical protein